MILQAPYPMIETSIRLPEADKRNTFTPQNQVTLLRTRRGLTRSYLNSSSEVQLNCSFSGLYKEKALELLEFYKAYSLATVRLIDHNNDFYVGRFTTDTLELSTPGATTATIIFKGTK